MHPEVGMVIYRERLAEIELENLRRRLARERAGVPPLMPARGRRRWLRWWHRAQRRVASGAGATTSRPWSAAT